MFLARVIGSVVSTKKDEAMTGHKLLLLRPMLVDEADPSKLRPGANTIVALDNLGAGKDDLVLFCQGSSARLTTGMNKIPTDAAVIGIVDQVEVMGRPVFNARESR